MNCKSLQQSIATCVSCVHSLNTQVLGEQKAKGIARIKRLNFSLGDICRWAYAKTGTQPGPRSAGVMEGTGCRRDPLPQPLWPPVPGGEGARRRCSLLRERAGDLRWEGRGGDEEPRATEGQRAGRRREARGEKRGAAPLYTGTETWKEGLVGCQGKRSVAGRWADVHKTPT